MTKQDKEELAAVVAVAIAGEFDKRKRIDEETHSAHHQYIEQQIESEKERKEFKKDVEKKVVGWGVIIAIGTLVTLIGDGVIGWLHKQ